VASRQSPPQARLLILLLNTEEVICLLGTTVVAVPSYTVLRSEKTNTVEVALS